MKTSIVFYLLLLSFYCKAQSSEALEYTLILNENRNGIEVKLRYKSIVNSDTIELLLPSSYDRFQMKNTVTVEHLDLISEGTLIKIAEDTSGSF